MLNPKAEMMRIGNELEKCGLPQRLTNKTAISMFLNKEFMHLTSSNGSSNANFSNCVIPVFRSDLIDPDARKAEEDIYAVAMKVYCELKSGEAFKDDYTWPIL